MRKALIETATGKVINVIEIEDGANWLPPTDYFLRDAENASPGDTWDGIRFVPIPPSSETIAAAKREEAKAAFLASLSISENTLPWGKMFKGLTIVLGWMEPE